jgi:hypothetical protein
MGAPAVVGVVLDGPPLREAGLAASAIAVVLGAAVLVRQRARSRIRRAVAEGNLRERAVLDVLASADPAALVVFTLRRARGYARQARQADITEALAGAAPLTKAARRQLDGLDRALSQFTISGIPVDDLVAARNLEGSARRLAAMARTQRPAAPGVRRAGRHPGMARRRPSRPA